MPASVRAAIDAYGGWLEPGDQVVVNDPFAGGTHLNDITVVTPGVRRRARPRRLGRQPGPPRRRRRRRARLDPGRRHRDPAGGPPHPADALHRGAARPAARRVAHARRAGRRPRRADRRQRRRLRAPRSPSATQPFDEVVAYGERRMRAALAALPDGRGGSTTCSTPPAPRRTSSTRRGSSSTVTVAGDEITFDFTGTDPQARGNVNARRGGHGLRGRLRAAHRDRPDHPGQRRLAATGARRRARGHARQRASRPPPSAPATSR